MNKKLFSLWLLLFPIITFAEGMTFAPPSSDYSVGFLANIFGVVDGVLHGTGSQIMGSIFAVFNAAVMALGGMIITYTMLVSTMNTAHEGEMLGKKWNSIWVPVRATGGFALLIPKASGYCLLQIFVMWVVVQGVGAADKLWDAALGYLNRGGVIIQAQEDPTAALTGNAGYQNVTKGAMIILSGQVCMLALQNVLQNLQKTVQSPTSSTCIAPTDPNMQLFCKSNTVPNFINTIDIIGAQDAATSDQVASSPATVSVPMPNFPPPALENPTDINLLYHQLNGICGVLVWDLLTPQQQEQLHSTSGTLTSGEINTALRARAIAIQQMFTDLYSVAQVMVNNDTLITAPLTAPTTPPSTQGSTPPPAPPKPVTAVEEFGIPLNNMGQQCTSTPSTTAPNHCNNWGSATGSGAVLLNGTELQGAVLDYVGVMKPTEALLNQVNNNSIASQGRMFISKASEQGWIMAGSYFFNLVMLNNQNTQSTTAAGSTLDPGLENSQFNLTTLTTSFNTTQPSVCPAPQTTTWTLNSSNSSTPSPVPQFPALCHLFMGQPSTITSGYPDAIINIIQLMTGENALTPTNQSVPFGALTEKVFGALSVKTGAIESSVLGYLNNALFITLPGQEGENQLQFADTMNIKFGNEHFTLPSASFPCGGFHILFVTICIGEIMGNIIYNGIIVNIMNFFVGVLLGMINNLIMSVLSIPLVGFGAIFKVGVQILSVQGINPIVALARMGTYYINFVGKLWLMQIGVVISLSLSMIGVFLLPFVAMAMPIIIAWAIIMLGVGFVTAYYVPVIPYMIFTFGALAWFMAVIEAVVAAPIVALGIVHPEGHDAFGKGEAAIMILMNVFLRPSMMIIGYIAAISLSYVGIWMLNAGFDNAIGFMQGGGDTGGGFGTTAHKQSAGLMVGETAATAAGGAAAIATAGVTAPVTAAATLVTNAVSIFKEGAVKLPSGGSVKGGYTEWAGIFAYFFSILIYTMIYMTIVEKAFSLISSLPDKVLRWIGGQPESYGSEVSQWTEQAKGKVQEAGKSSGDAMAQSAKQSAGFLSSKMPTPSSGGMTGSGGGGGGDSAGGAGAGGAKVGGGEPPAGGAGAGGAAGEAAAAG